MELYELALRRAEAPNLAEFQRREGLPPTGRADGPTWAALLPWLRGYRVYSTVPGDNYTRIAARYGTTVRALITANPNQDPLRLYVGQLLTVPLGFDLVPTDLPFTYELLSLCLEGLRARYPFLGLRNIGETAYGRKIPRITVGLGPRRVLYNAAHHANEWITTPLLLKFLESYARAVSENGRIFGFSAQALYQRTTLELVPMVNPDGVELVTGGLREGEPGWAEARALADSYPAIPFPEGWKANLRGVDLNLNYPARWEQAREIKFAQGYTRPGPRDYVGTGPLSEPESEALARLTERTEPGLSLSYHSQGSVIFWKFLSMEPPGARELGERFAAVSGYSLEDVPYASGFAGYKDWFILTRDRPGYTIEVGMGENPLPLSQFDEIYRRNLGILTLGLAEG
ncbi:MAG: LysM peptidoglycan-binding domain-containing protein [Oscillospiraceae bacterium]|nr:LysM peptidoglycan-binding domain-containing protein [Oscillospiraceae bacterium]MBR4193686.1 LysM peptidoglycan-binding domain-containing protein [Oscillospiraceae bacterium]